MGRRRERRRRLLVALKWISIFGVYVAIGFVAHQGGEEIAARKVTMLKNQIAGLNEKISTLDSELRQLATAHERLKITEAGLQKRIDKEIPTGSRKELLSIVEKRLGDGVRKDRLAFALSQVRNKPACDATPMTKRFIVRTVFTTGNASSVSFFGNRITVTGRGEPSADGEGKPQAWFDPERKVTMRFSWVGGRGTEKTGVLPLHHRVAEGKSEHRFTVVRGDSRGFAYVTWVRCDFPG